MVSYGWDSQPEDRQQARDRPDELRRPAYGAQAPLQVFACISCGHVFNEMPRTLPAWEDCDAQCAICPSLICADRPGEDDE